MAQAERLALLKTDLGMYGDIPDTTTAFLTALLVTAADLIARQGVTLDDSRLEDDSFLASYAAWLYRKRAAASDDPMPRMLSHALHLRIVGEAMGRRADGGEAKPDDL